MIFIRNDYINVPNTVIYWDDLSYVFLIIILSMFSLLLLLQILHTSVRIVIDTFCEHNHVFLIAVVTTDNAHS